MSELKLVANLMAVSLMNEMIKNDDKLKANETEKFTIVYEGEDYKNATNNPDANITYTIALEQKTVELYKEQTSIQKDSEGGNVSIDIGAAVELGLYESGSNSKVLLKTWDELIEEGDYSCKQCSYYNQLYL